MSYVTIWIAACFHVIISEPPAHYLRSDDHSTHINFVTSRQVGRTVCLQSRVECEEVRTSKGVVERFCNLTELETPEGN